MIAFHFFLHFLVKLSIVCCYGFTKFPNDDDAIVVVVDDDDDGDDANADDGDDTIL